MASDKSQFGNRNESRSSRGLVNGFIHGTYKETKFLIFYVISIGASGSQGCMSHL